MRMKKSWLFIQILWKIHYNRKPFAANGLSIKVVGGGSGWGRNWNYGDEPSDLLGTARTLDGCDGAMKLSDDAYLKGDTPMNEKYSGKSKWSMVSSQEKALLLWMTVIRWH